MTDLFIYPKQLKYIEVINSKSNSRIAASRYLKLLFCTNLCSRVKCQWVFLLHSLQFHWSPLSEKACNHAAACLECCTEHKQKVCSQGGEREIYKKTTTLDWAKEVFERILSSWNLGKMVEIQINLHIEELTSSDFNIAILAGISQILTWLIDEKRREHRVKHMIDGAFIFKHYLPEK